MDDCNIDKAVVFPFNEMDPGISFSKANKFIAGEVKRFSNRLIGFARLDPNAGHSALDELDNAVDKLDLRGVKLHPKGQAFTQSNPYVLKIIKRASDFGVPVVFDNGKEILDNYAIGRFAKKAPQANLILAHMRGEGFIEVPKAHKNVYLGTVKAPFERVVKAVKILGPDKIIAGSDSPYTDMNYEMSEKFDELNLPEEDRKLITGGNIFKILNE